MDDLSATGIFVNPKRYTDELLQRIKIFKVGVTLQFIEGEQRPTFVCSEPIFIHPNSLSLVVGGAATLLKTGEGGRQRLLKYITEVFRELLLLGAARFEDEDPAFFGVTPHAEVPDKVKEIIDKMVCFDVTPEKAN